jgi:hypothetical protein
MSTDNDEQYKNSPQWIKDIIDKKGDKMNEARDIFHKFLIRACAHCDEPIEAQKALDEYNENVDTALKQLRELVERKKKKLFGCHSFFGKDVDRDIVKYNQAISDISDMIYKEKSK